MKHLSLRRTVAALALCAVLAGGLLVAGKAQAAPADFVGTWVNPDFGTGGIVRLQMSQGASGLGVHAFGACSPSPCDWGTTALITYGNNVSDADHKHGTAVYSFGFKQTAMTFQLVDDRTLVVHHYNQFTTGSGRQNYHGQEVFRKVVIRPPEPPVAPGPPVGP